MINSETNQMTYTTVAGVGTYTIGFTYFLNMSNEPELQVTLDGVTLVYGRDYTLSEDELSIEFVVDPDTEEFVVDPGEGKTLIISRDVPLTQTSDYVVGRIDPDQIERDFDRSVMRDQDIRLDVGIIESKIPAEASPDNQLADKAYVDAHTERTDNPHNVTKAQVGLGNCDNTSDLDKPISTATQAILDLKANSADLAAVATAGTLVSLNDTSIVHPAVGHFLMYDGVRWINTVSSGTVGWGAILGNITDQTDLMNKFAEYVRTDGTSVMTAPLLMRATDDFKCAIAPYWDGIGFFKLNDNNSVTLIASLEYQDSFAPAENNVYNIGSTSKKWKNLYLTGKAYMSVINNGFDIAVPVTNSADTFALKSQVDDAANSGEQLYTTGVWYAKMYSASVVPTGAEYDGKNYADFSQVDNDNNPILVIYEGQSGSWVELTRITPPANHVGYLAITSKIWDIAEQSGQQGGQVLWSWNNKTFTPYPRMVSFDGANITNSTITTSTFSGEATLSGDSTITMSENPTNDSIVNKEYVDTHAGTSSYHPGLFAHEWDDHLRNDVQWLRADTFSWQQGSVYKAAYKHLRNDTYNWYSWENNGTTIYTKKAYPEVGEKAYSNSALTTEVGEITAVTDTLDITVEKITVNGVVYDSVSGSNIAPTTETVGGVTVQYIPAEDGHKIVTDFHESEVADVYTATGVAWYYIIDYGFKRFKLPRTKFGITGLRDTVGNYVAPGLPNIRADLPHNFRGMSSYPASGTETNGAFTTEVNSSGQYSGTGTYYRSVALSFNANQYDSTYKDGATVQPPATQMYLYFYVGEFTQTAIENTAGLNAELFNDKADTDLSNTPIATADYVVEWQAPTANNNYTWYRKYKSGWVEQGRHYTSSKADGSTTTFPVQMADTNYTVQMTLSQAGDFYLGAYNQTTTGMTFRVHNRNAEASSCLFDWEVKGMVA